MTLSDASSFFVAMRVWEQRPFHDDDVLSPERLHQILTDSLRISVRFRALDLLARNEHSRFTLDQKLQPKLRQRGLDTTIIPQILDELVEEGALSDRRFAETWIRSRILRHPEGRSHLAAGLRQRGVSIDVAEEAIDAVLSNDKTTLVDSARRFAETTVRRKSPTSEQLSAALYRRGFRGDVVQQVVSEFAEDHRH